MKLIKGSRVNTVTITGVLTVDFSVKTSRKSQTEFLIGNLAVNGARNTSTNELSYDVDAEFFSLTVFSEAVQRRAKLFTKGMPVLIMGELERQFFVNPQTGKKSFSKRIIVSEIIPYAQSEELTQVVCNAIQGFISQKRSGTFSAPQPTNMVATAETTRPANAYGFVNNFDHNATQQRLQNVRSQQSQSINVYNSSESSQGLNSGYSSHVKANNQSQGNNFSMNGFGNTFAHNSVNTTVNKTVNTNQQITKLQSSTYDLDCYDDLSSFNCEFTSFVDDNLANCFEESYNNSYSSNSASFSQNYTQNNNTDTNSYSNECYANITENNANIIHANVNNFGACFVVKQTSTKEQRNRLFREKYLERKREREKLKQLQQSSEHNTNYTYQKSTDLTVSQQTVTNNNSSQSNVNLANFNNSFNKNKFDYNQVREYCADQIYNTDLLTNFDESTSSVTDTNVCDDNVYFADLSNFNQNSRHNNFIAVNDNTYLNDEYYPNNHIQSSQSSLTNFGNLNYGFQNTFNHGLR